MQTPFSIGRRQAGEGDRVTAGTLTEVAYLLLDV